jgi:hypothetical protein
MPEPQCSQQNKNQARGINLEQQLIQARINRCMWFELTGTKLKQATLQTHRLKNAVRPESEPVRASMIRPSRNEIELIGPEATRNNSVPLEPIMPKCCSNAGNESRENSPCSFC